MNQKCSGCGIVLQSDHPNQPGYIPIKKIQESTKGILCQRCFRIQHYNEISPLFQQEEDMTKIFAQIAKSRSLVVQVIDLFDFDGSVIPGVHRRIGNNPLVLLANKIDLFPKSTKFGKLKNWLNSSARELGIRPIYIDLISAEKGWNIKEAFSEIDRLRQGTDVYVIGAANVGKSTLINHLLRPEEKVTTSRYPGTTLSTIKIPLHDGKAIIDTPGKLQKDRLSEWLTPKECKIVIPNQPMKPRIYQLQDQQTLFFGGLVRLDYVKGPKQPFVCYVSNQLLIHRTKRANADRLQDRQFGRLLVPPADRSLIPRWKKHRIHLAGKEKEDIVIAGLGFISSGQAKAEIDLWVPEGIRIGIRPAII